MLADAEGKVGSVKSDSSSYQTYLRGKEIAENWNENSYSIEDKMEYKRKTMRADKTLETMIFKDIKIKPMTDSTVQVSNRISLYETREKKRERETKITPTFAY